MSKSVKAGSPGLRKCLRRYRGFSLRGIGGGGHAEVVAPDGTVVRLPDGKKVTVPSSPKNGSVAARQLERTLVSLGISPGRTA